jgi:mono/diheme cytochrome c family protein
MPPTPKVCSVVCVSFVMGLLAPSLVDSRRFDAQPAEFNRNFRSTGSPSGYNDPVTPAKSTIVARASAAWALPAVLAACSGNSPGEATPAPPPDGQAVFEMACRRCHGAEGRGDGPLAPTFGPVPDLNAADLGARYTRAELEALVRAGRGKMPAHQGRLMAEELTAVIDHVERRFLGRTPP